MKNRRRSKVVGVILALATSSLPASAQQKYYPNVTQFFSDNTYGTLAFVLGANHSADIPRGPFLPVHEGTVQQLPKQRGYCFAVQHYGNQPIDARHSYTINFYANDLETGSKTPVDLGFSSSFRITDRSSADMPTYCFLRRGRERFWLEISSSDGEWLDGSFEFLVGGA